MKHSKQKSRFIFIQTCTKSTCFISFRIKTHRAVHNNALPAPSWGFYWTGAFPIGVTFTDAPLTPNTVYPLSVLPVALRNLVTPPVVAGAAAPPLYNDAQRVETTLAVRRQHLPGIEFHDNAQMSMYIELSYWLFHHTSVYCC